ncbi:MAG TPA: membrane dipeptidase [Woeseiaceae bacterium]
MGVRITRRQAIRAIAGSVTLAMYPAAGEDRLARLYDSALVIDGLSFGRDWSEPEFRALAQAGYAGIVESLPRRDLQAAIDALVEWRRRVERHSEALLIALTAADFERAKREHKTAVLLNFQNATMLEGAVDNVDALHALGMRSFQLTYNYRNRLGDGCLERTNAGLSELGIAVVERMNRIGVLVDLSHCGRQTTDDGIAFSEKPVAITHTMCEALRRNHPRAKTDAQIRACAEKGGVVGIAALGYFLGPDPGGDTTIEAYADHIEHAVAVAGHEHVALSSDFPPQGIASWATRENWYEPRLKSFEPSYEVRWPPWIPELDAPERFLNVARVLERRGWTAGRLELLLGRNWLRLFRDVIG